MCQGLYCLSQFLVDTSIDKSCGLVQIGRSRLGVNLVSSPLTFISDSYRIPVGPITDRYTFK